MKHFTWKMNFTWHILFAITIAYGIIVLVFPFAGLIANSIHFTRITVSFSGFLIYVRMMPTLFLKVPAPIRDYMLSSIFFFLLSLCHFSFLNEAHRIIEAIDNDVFTGYLAGAGSMYAIVACVLAFIAADIDDPEPKRTAIIIAIIVAIALTISRLFVAPWLQQ